jgi:hypothetical protein
MLTKPTFALTSSLRSHCSLHRQGPTAQGRDWRRCASGRPSRNGSRSNAPKRKPAYGCGSCSAPAFGCANGGSAQVARSRALVAYLCSDGLLQAYTTATRKRLSIATACLTTSRAKLSSSSAYSEWPSWRLRVASANYRVARLRNRSASSMSRSSRHL